MGNFSLPRWIRRRLRTPTLPDLPIEVLTLIMAQMDDPRKMALTCHAMLAEWCVRMAHTSTVTPAMYELMHPHLPLYVPLRVHVPSIKTDKQQLRLMARMRAFPVTALTLTRGERTISFLQHMYFEALTHFTYLVPYGKARTPFAALHAMRCIRLECMPQLTHVVVRGESDLCNQVAHHARMIPTVRNITLRIETFGEFRDLMLTPNERCGEPKSLTVTTFASPLLPNANVRLRLTMANYHDDDSIDAIYARGSVSVRNSFYRLARGLVDIDTFDDLCNQHIQYCEKLRSLRCASFKIINDTTNDAKHLKVIEAADMDSARVQMQFPDAEVRHRKPIEESERSPIY